MINSFFEIPLGNLITIRNTPVQEFYGTKKYISTGDFETENFETVTYKSKPTRANLSLFEGQITLAKMKGTEKVKIVTKSMEDNIYSTGLFAIEPREIDLKYLSYLLRYSRFIQEKDSLSFGTTQPSINEDRLKSIKVIVASEHNSQVAITNYLDEQNTIIDNLVETEYQQIEKLKEYKQSLITSVVLRGLDKTTPFKDSGVLWIGKIPEAWRVCRIKDVFNLNNDRTDETNLENVNLISLYTDKGVVQHSDLEETTGNKAVTAEGYKTVRKNDIVVNIILCWMGAIGMSSFDGVTSPAYDVYTPKHKTNSKYYHYLFRTNRFNGECFRYGRGIMLMRWRTYSTEFLSINIPNPDFETQNKIVEYLDKKCKEVDDIIKLKKEKIELLTKYKESVIYEYVTGKKEVTA